MYFFFFYPVGTESSGGRRPLGTLLLLGVLLAVFALRYLDPNSYLQLIRSSFRPSDPQLGAALLSLFLHGGWVHLGGNALYLWIFGRQLESRLGFTPVVMLYLAGGVVACWTQAALTPADAWNRSAPLIGASGSVAAILGATVLRFPHIRVRVLWVLFALIVMRLQGVNANIMSLGGIAIAIGAMVDAAVVMIENAHKKIERWEAAHPGEHLHGEKRWIGNGSITDVVVVWARSTDDGQVKGFLVETDDPGFSAETLNGKGAARAIWQAQITLDGARAEQLPQANSFKDAGRVLVTTRTTCAWAALGHAINVVTGMVFTTATPDQYALNVSFLWKIVFLVVAGLSLLYTTVFEGPWHVDAGKEPPLRVKLAGATSILSWLLVMYFGRMLPFLGNAF